MRGGRLLPTTGPSCGSTTTSGPILGRTTGLGGYEDWPQEGTTEEILAAMHDGALTVADYERIYDLLPEHPVAAAERQS